MTTLSTRITPLILLLIFSCTVQEEAIIEQETTTDNSVLMEMVNSSWKLNDCPSNPTLNIEGFTECDYLNYISFSEDAVFIRHGNNNFFTRHNICFVDGMDLIVSRLGCGFTDWSGLSEWKIITLSDGSLEIEVRYPNLNASYQERFAYEID